MNRRTKRSCGCKTRRHTKACNKRRRSRRRRGTRRRMMRGGNPLTDSFNNLRAAIGGTHPAESSRPYVQNLTRSVNYAKL